MSEVTLNQILKAREDRVELQRTLLRKHRCALICFTMNIAGPTKINPAIERAFRYGLRALTSVLPSDAIREQSVITPETGCQAMLSVDMDAQRLKEICVQIEEQTPLGRLFDMDVLDADGNKLARSELRGCIVCGVKGRGCAARRLHTVTELQSATTQIIERHFQQIDFEEIAEDAKQCLLDEVATTPKPGLVDLRNNGSHSDMNPSTFIASAHALKPYFKKCLEIGRLSSKDAAQKCHLLLKKAGLDAEKAMYSATNGVNTHKGAIYTLGILCGSIGRLWSVEQPIAESTVLLSECATLVETSVRSDFASMTGETAGERLYLQYGLQGIRGEVARGLPSVMNLALPVLKQYLQQGLSFNDAGALVLLHLIARVQDTNLYHRGGHEGAAFAARSARELIDTEKIPSIQQIEALDDAFIARNLSPGGCADLLAVTYFVHKLELRRCAP